MTKPAWLLAAIIALGLGGGSGCSPASAAVAPPMAFTAGYIPRLQPFGDSITFGVGAAVKAGWREDVYFAAQAAGKKLFFVGSMSNAGAGNGLAVDPYNEGISGIQAVDLNTLLFRIGTYHPDVVLYAAGTNDLASNVGNQTPAVVAQRISDGLDATWALRTSNHFQIVLCTVLKRLDADDSKVVTLNALLPAVVAGKSYAANVTLLDVYAAISSPTVGVNMNDVVHPNDVGYSSMATVIYQGVAPVLVKARGRAWSRPAWHRKQRLDSLQPRRANRVNVDRREVSRRQRA